MALCIILLLVFYPSHLVLAAYDDDVLAKFTQSDYKLKDLIFEQEFYDKDFFNIMETKIFKPNRTIQAVNASVNFKVAIHDKLEVITQAYKFLSNQFKPFPVRVHFKVCSVMNANVLGLQNMFKCGNFSGCFYEKDVTYHICNFIPDLSKLPPLIPDGRYMARIQLIFQNKIISSAKGYAEVYRPIYVPDKKK